MSNLCENCKWWGIAAAGNDNDKHSPLPIKPCGNPKHVYGYIGFDKAQKLPDDTILVENDEGWGMLTGAKFGCVNFEKRGTQ